MAIHRIHHDDTYLIYEMSTREVLNKLGREHPFHIDRSPVAYSGVWKEPLIITFTKIDSATKNTVPDIAVRSGRLFMSDKAYNALNKLLAKDGEFLPVTYSDGKGYIFNPLAIAEDLEALNTERTAYDQGGNLAHFEFIESKLGHTSLFRAKVDNCSGVFCSDPVKSAIEKAELTGVYFQPDLANFAGESALNTQ